ncbi:type IV pilus biogenesis/stability protein PilW [Guyparkeria sp. GHLCS8-2]|uniref:type IV pilus biogenesis/stability protein PilW n=1 Tax=Guyparkeria halopsychrophila TaxID=3139421 RepID=UPI0037CBE960
MSHRLLSVCALVLLGLTGCATTGGMESDRGSIERHVGENRQAAEINTELAAGYMRQGELKVSMEKVRRAIRFDSGYAPAHHVHALLLQRLGEDDKAAKAFAQAVRLDGENSDMANNYGGFLCSQGDYERAQAMFRRAYGDPLYETPEYALVNSGRCYQQAGDQTQALAQFRRAMDEGARQPAALLGLAQALLETGEGREAAEAMRQYESRHRHTPRSLSVAIAIDRAVSDEQALNNHRLILRGRFPDSPEAQAQALEQEGSR